MPQADGPFYGFSRTRQAPKPYLSSLLVALGRAPGPPPRRGGADYTDGFWNGQRSSARPTGTPVRRG
jgi:hypothetical protein